jgi:hypothetical protein
MFQILVLKLLAYIAFGEEGHYSFDSKKLSDETMVYISDLQREQRKNRA